MCSENGFLSDDGVVVKLSEDAYLCHTTSGGSDRIHAHMEEWLQTEWWDWNVYVANLTEQYAQVGVVGPKARDVLEKLGGLDVSKEALGFMEYAEGRLGAFDVRAFRISFSGELSYEIAVPAGQGLAFWQAHRSQTTLQPSIQGSLVLQRWPHRVQKANVFCLKSPECAFCLLCGWQ